MGWEESDLARHPKGQPEKVRLAQALRRATPMTRQWIARRLRMGSASYLSYLLGQAQEAEVGNSSLEDPR